MGRYKTKASTTFGEHYHPQIRNIDTNMIVNVVALSPDDYAECAAHIDTLDHIPAIELTSRSGNVKQGGMAFGVTCCAAAVVESS